MVPCFSKSAFFGQYWMLTYFPRLDPVCRKSVVYLDGSCLQGETYQACLDNISDNIKFSRELGFVIQIEKSVFKQLSSLALSFHQKI